METLTIICLYQGFVLETVLVCSGVFCPYPVSSIRRCLTFIKQTLIERCLAGAGLGWSEIQDRIDGWVDLAGIISPASIPGRVIFKQFTFLAQPSPARGYGLV